MRAAPLMCTRNKLTAVAWRAHSAASSPCSSTTASRRRRWNSGSRAWAASSHWPHWRMMRHLWRGGEGRERGLQVRRIEPSWSAATHDAPPVERRLAHGVERRAVFARERRATHHPTCSAHIHGKRSGSGCRRTVSSATRSMHPPQHAEVRAHRVLKTWARAAQLVNHGVADAVQPDLWGEGRRRVQGDSRSAADTSHVFQFSWVIATRLECVEDGQQWQVVAAALFSDAPLAARLPPAHRAS